MEYFNENISSLGGLNKKLIEFLSKYQFWPFLTTWVHLKIDFLNLEAKFQKIREEFTGGFIRNVVLNFELSIFRKVHGVDWLLCKLTISKIRDLS